MNESELKLIAYINDFLEKESQSILALKKYINEDFLSIVTLLLKNTGRIFITGIGTSGLVARRMAHLFSCFEMPVINIHPSDGLHGASGAIQKEDIVFIFSKGGDSDEVNKFASICRDRGACIISVTEKPLSPLGMLSDHVLLYSSIENKDQEFQIAFSNSLCASAFGDALSIGLMKLKKFNGKDFGVIHPGGAVGKELNKK